MKLLLMTNKYAAVFALFGGICLSTSSLELAVSADASEISPTSLRAVATTIAQPRAQKSANLTVVAQNDAGENTATTTIPENLRYIFDLPWCTRWHFRCMSCEKTDTGIRCFDRKDACNETFSFYACEQFNLPKGCVAWLNGCNFCDKKRCTLKPCQEYLAPNRPSFACLRYEPDGARGGER